MKKILIIPTMLAHLFVFFSIAQSEPVSDKCNALKVAPQVGKKDRAAWMEGKWGFRFNMPSMRDPQDLAEFDVQKMMEQIKVLDTASWVQINITQGASGS